MKPLKRNPTHKSKSASVFRNNVSHTKGINLGITPMRGGWRL